MNEIAKKLKDDLVKRLTQNKQNADEKYIVVGEKSYSRREIAEEIDNETDFGISFLTNMIRLAIDLTSRQKNVTI